MTDDDLVPVSVRLGEVVPPEDPEDWTRPLTWVAAVGMLAGPLAALSWFAIAPPVEATQPVGATYLVAAALAAGAAITGATQIGRTRAWTATLGAGLFAALVVILLGVVMAGERQVATASPTLAHAFAAAAAGLAGAAAAALVAGLAAHLRSRIGRGAAAGVAGAVTAIGVVALLISPTLVGRVS
jgi:MFS family permease